MRLGTAPIWIGLGTFLAVLYGIANDQITVTLSPEYFSVFKRAQFGPALDAAGLSQAPTRVQAVLVGSLATWWFGGFLGIALSVIGVAGRRRPLPTRDYLRAVVAIMLFTLCLSFFCGMVSFIMEPAIKPTVEGWPFLTGIHAVRAAFAVGWWHNGAYLGGALGTLLAGIWIRKRRGGLAKIPNL
jgi:hypothetical protein